MWAGTGHWETAAGGGWQGTPTSLSHLTVVPSPGWGGQGGVAHVPPRLLSPKQLLTAPCEDSALSAQLAGSSPISPMWGGA